MSNYIKESFKELSKVSWPTMNRTIQLTIFVVIFSAIMAASLGALDYVLNASYQGVVDYSIQQNLGSVTTSPGVTVEPDATTGTPIEVNATTEDGNPITIEAEPVETPEQ